MGSLFAIKSVATAEQITRVIGTKNSHVLHDIQRIGPTLEEVCEAYGCLDVSGRLQAILERSMHARTRKVFFLLKRGRLKKEGG